MSKLTQERVLELFDYDPETGILLWNTCVANIKQGSEAGCVGKGGYKLVGINYKIYYVHRIIWLYVHGYFPENQIDHINQDRLDNRLVNLREISRSCNMRNIKKIKSNTSGVKGVTFDRFRNKWVAQIAINKKNIYLGRYSEYSNAVCARLAAEQCCGWNDCENKSSAFKFVQESINGGCK